MKVRMISVVGDPVSFQTQLNEFIRGKIIIDIKYTSICAVTKYYFNGTPAEANIIDRALIVYES